MKIEQQKTDRKLLVGIVLFLLFIAIILGTLCFYKHYRNANSNIPEQISKELEIMDFDFLNGNDTKIRTIADVAVPIIEKLVKETNNKEEMAAILEDSFFNCGLSFTQEEAAVLAEWLVEFYTKNYMEDSDSSLPEMSDVEYKNILINEMHQDLDSIYEYLSKLDETVINNKNEIVNLTTGQTGSFESVTVYLESLHSTIKNLQKQFTAYENEYQDTQNTTTSEFSSITLQLDNISESIMNTQSEITANIHNIDNSNAARYESLNSTINNFASSFRKDLESVNKSISKLISDIQKDNAEQNKELAETLTETHEELLQVIDSMDEKWTFALEQIKEKLTAEIEESHGGLSGQLSDTQKSLSEEAASNKTGISSQISSSEKSLSDELKNASEKINNQVNKSENEITSELIDSRTQIQSQLSGSEKTLTQGIDSGISLILTNLDSVHEDITLTQSEIKNILNDMKTADEEKMMDIINRFAGVNNKLVNINSAMENAHNDIKGLISSLQSSTEKNQEKLLEALTTIDSSFSSQNSENFELLVNSMQTQTDTVHNWFNSLNNSVTSNFESLSNTVTNIEQSALQNKDEVLNNFNQSFSNLSAAMGDLGQAVTGSKDEIIQRLTDIETKTDIRFSDLDTSIQSVFQSVSDGKKILATALLTKNITVADDATFEEIQQAILEIPQKIVIGVEQVPGEIEYTYHYHSGDAANGGGCYTTRLYHQHSVNCYTKAVCQPYCLGLTHTSRNDHWDVHENSRFMHPDCGMGVIYRSPKHYVGDPCNCDHMDSHTYDKLSCGKTNATPEAWTTGCGFVDGQIIEVRIVYNSDAVKARAATTIVQTKEYIPQIYDDYKETPSQSTGQENTEETEQETTDAPVETSEPETEVVNDMEATAEIESSYEESVETEQESKTEVSNETKQDVPIEAESSIPDTEEGEK